MIGAILNEGDFSETIKHYAQLYPHAGYGGTFRRWMWSWENQPYNSWGNGSAMRVSPVGFAFDITDEVLSYNMHLSPIFIKTPELMPNNMFDKHYVYDT